MDTIQSLDAVVTEMAVALHTSSPLPGLPQVRLFAKVAPDGPTAGPGNELLATGGLRWFKPVLRVKRDSRFSAEFEYKDVVHTETCSLASNSRSGPWSSFTSARACRDCRML